MKVKEDFRRKLVEEFELDFEKEYVPDELNDKLTEVYNSLYQDKSMLEQYGVEPDKNGHLKFYVKKPVGITDDELNHYMTYKMLKMLETVQQQQKLIYYFIKFMIVIGAIGALFWLITLLLKEVF